MKKIFYFSIMIFLSLNIFSQTNNNKGNNSNDQNIIQIRKELEATKKDVSDLKDKTAWFSFKIGGSVKTTFGVAIWSKDGYNVNSSMPVTTGFDFENKIRLQMDLGNRIIASSRTDNDDGTQISIKVKMKSMGFSKQKPQGSYYIIDATTDQGKKVQVYYPRTDSGTSNVSIGNFQIALEEAKVKNIVGTGAFVNYLDVQTVHQYYGVGGMVDVLKLNHLYFNNGFANSKSVLYYFFATDYYDKKSDTITSYEPGTEEPDAVQFWNDGTLGTRNGRVQNPHGIAGGFDGDLSEGVHLYVEGGIASKDAFDPRYYEDNQIDYGLFIKGGVNFYTGTFSIYPKLALGFATQTNTTVDNYVADGYNTLSVATSLPFEIALPTGKKDKVKLEANWNMMSQFKDKQFAQIFSLSPEFRVLNKKLTFSIPFIYSYKLNQDGFIRVGNENIYWLDQQKEHHLINFGFVASFDSMNLFGDMFEYVLTNKIYFTDNHIMGTQLISAAPELFFYEIFRNEWILHDIGPLRFTMFFEFGYGMARNARMINPDLYLNTTTNLWYDRTTGQTVSLDASSALNVMLHAHVLSFQTGFDMEIIKNLLIGFSAESPKLLLNSSKTIGNQYSFGTFKFWSEIKF